MPYKLDDPRLPDNVKDLNPTRRRQWVNIFNQAFTTCVSGGGSGETCEGSAFRQANGVVFNDGEDMNFTEETIKMNAATIAKPKRRKVGGIDYLIAPTVMVKQGVLNDEFVPLDEISAHFSAWNGAPFVIDHPQTPDGLHISANDPRILDGAMIGRVFNVELDGSSLKGELWVDLALAETVERGKEVVSRLEKGEPLEVSTAYFRDREEVEGTFEGTSYEAVTRNLRPDHLAALLDTEGACSWQDGCGAPRTNEADGSDEPTAQSDTEVIEMEELIKQLLDAGSLGLNEDELKELPKEVLQKLADYLAAQESSEDDEEEEEGDETEEPAGSDGDEPEDDDEPASNAGEPCSKVAALIEAIDDRGGPEAVFALIDGIQANTDAEKESLIGKIVANDTSALTRAQLAAMDVEVLTALHKSLSPASYAGQGGGDQVSTNEETAYELPGMFAS